MRSASQLGTQSATQSGSGGAPATHEITELRARRAARLRARVLARGRHAHLGVEAREETRRVEQRRARRARELAILGRTALPVRGAAGGRGCGIRISPARRPAAEGRERERENDERRMSTGCERERSPSRGFHDFLLWRTERRGGWYEAHEIVFSPGDLSELIRWRRAPGSPSTSRGTEAFRATRADRGRRRRRRRHGAMGATGVPHRSHTTLSHGLGNEESPSNAMNVPASKPHDALTRTREQRRIPRDAVGFGTTAALGITGRKDKIRVCGFSGFGSASSRNRLGAGTPGRDWDRDVRRPGAPALAERVRSRTSSSHLWYRVYVTYALRALTP